MKITLMILLAAIGVTVAMAQTNPPAYSPSSAADSPPYQPSVPVAAQVYGGGEYWYDHGSPGTAAGSALQGMASVVNAAGNYNLATSAAAVNMTQAQKQDIENWSSFTNTYFDMRAMNRRARAEERGKPATPEQIIRIAQYGVPKSLNTEQLDPVSGKISWPGVLQGEEFEKERAALEGAFAEQAKYGGWSFASAQTVRKATQAMLDQLADMVRDIPSSDYIPAKKFIQSLAYEARKAA